MNYLYKITNLVNNKIYIGVHKTDNLNDGYMGSGKIIGFAIEKHGLENFKKDILEFFDTYELALAKEAEIVTDEFLLREDVYNLRRGGSGGFDYINSKINQDWRKETGIKFTSLINEKFNNDPEFRQVESNRRSAVSRQTRVKYPVSINFNFVGRSHSDATKRIIGEKNSENHRGSANSQFGTMWITDGITDSKIKKDIPVPTGWHRGRAKKVK